MLGAASLAQAGNCVEKHARDFSFVELAVPEGSPRPADAAAFSFIDETTTFQALVEKIGPPDGAMGSGVTIYVWCVPDGEVRLWTADGTTIGAVRHNGKLIYDRKKKKS
jgi:hypothetical protein